MTKRETGSQVQVQEKSSSSTVTGSSSYSIGQPKMLYKQAEIYMVPLHEVEEIAQEDWFLETINIIAGVVLGVAVERLMSNPEISWGIIGFGSVAVIIYRIRRKHSQEKKINDLKKSAITINNSSDKT
jgi:hypothetical protein